MEHSATRTILAILKIGVLIPTSLAVENTKVAYDVIQGNPQFLNSAAYHNVHLAYAMAYFGCIALLPWSIISMFLPCIPKFKGIHFFVAGVVDLVFASIIAAAIGLQRLHTTEVTGLCSERTTTYAGVRSEGQWSSTRTTTHALCEWVWRHSPEFDLAALVFQLITAYVGIFSVTNERSILNPLRLTYLFCLMPVKVHKWLRDVPTKPLYDMYNYIKPWRHFAYRYTAQFLRGFFGRMPIELPEAVTYTPRTEQPVTNTKLQQIFNIEHILLPVVESLCYEDVINLSLTSRAVRETVYPHMDLEYRVPKLKKRCCDPETKKKCKYCNKPVCKNCETIFNCPGLTGSHHVTHCKPYCVSCYYKECTKLRVQHLPSVGPCKCALRLKAPSEDPLCRTCARKAGNFSHGLPLIYLRNMGIYITHGLEKLHLLKLMRYRQEVRDIAFGVRSQRGGPGKEPECDKCKKALPDGVRFWFCGKCQRECRGHIHPPCVRRKRGKRPQDVDVERGEAVELQEMSR